MGSLSRRVRRRKGQSKASLESKVKESRRLAKDWPSRPTGIRGVWHIDQHGNRVEGRASPARLPDNLAALPGEIVTKDSSDPDRAHELDPPHVVEQYAYDYRKAEAEDGKSRLPTPKELVGMMSAPVGEVVPITQARVDLVRHRVGMSMLDRWVHITSRGVDVDTEEPHYVWFCGNNVNEYELRKGYPPHRMLRPGYLRDIRLSVNPLRAPRSVRDLFESAGVVVGRG